MTEYRLSIALIPPLLWGENLRKWLPKEQWRTIQTETFARSSQCEYCGCSPNARERHAHEDWSYCGSIARLEAVRTVCWLCHLIKHHGFLNAAVKDGRLPRDTYYSAKRHFCMVNNCEIEDYESHYRQAVTDWKQRGRIATWIIDTSAYRYLVAPRLVA